MNPEKLAQIRSKILQHEKLDEVEKADLLDLLPNPEGDKPEDHNLGEELADIGRELRYAVRRFEARHPQFTETADKVMHFLSRMGI